MIRILLLVLLVLLPAASAQVSPSADLGVSLVEVAPEPIVNVSSLVTTWIVNPSPNTVLVTLEYEYGDGTPLNATSPARYPPRYYVPPGNHSFNFTFIPPRERAGEGSIVVRATTTADPDTLNNTATRRVFVRNPALNVTFEDPASLDVLPGGGVSFLRYFVRNDGNAVDVANMSLLVDAPWAAQVLGALPPIEPQQSATGLLLVRGDTDNRSLNLSLYLAANSTIRTTLNASANAPLLHVNETALARRHAVAIQPLPPEVQLFAGERYVQEVTVQNAGEAPDVFWLNASWEGNPAGWSVRAATSPAWPANLSRPNETLPYPLALLPGESRSVSLVLVREATAANTTARLHVNASSANAAILSAVSDGAHNATRTIRALDAGPDLALVDVGLPGVVYEGDNVSFRFDVRNVGRVGTGNATLRVELRDNLRTVAETALPLAPLAPGARAASSWSVDTSGLQGTYALSAHLALNGTLQDRNLTNGAATRSIHVRTPLLEVRAPETLRLVPGGTLRLSGAAQGLSVENRGSHAEALHVTLASPESWLSRSWELTVPAGAVQAIAFDLDVPEFPHAREIEATFSAHVANRTRFSDATAIRFLVDDVDPPEIRHLSPAGETVVGVPVRVAAQLRDAVGVARAEAVLLTPSGGRLVLLLVPEEAAPDVYAAPYVPQEAGRYRLEYRVEDATPDGHLGVLPGIEWRVVQSPYDGVRPANFDDGGTVRARLLRFAEAAVGTTRSLHVDVGEGLREVPPPYEIQADWWTEGAHQVRARAVSHNGTTWERTWNVTLDVTPPGLADPAAAPASGGRLQISVRAEEAATALARFETPRGPVEVALESRGGGRFGALVTPPESWGSLVFVARDAAGNEGSVTLSQDSHDAPAPPVSALVLLLAAAAIATRRRR